MTIEIQRALDEVRKNLEELQLRGVSGSVEVHVASGAPQKVDAHYSVILSRPGAARALKVRYNQ